ncbi:hypothetical protein R50912_27950 [Paenibacillus sp. FSL R5-0912]|nr:hypothetical protein R50912_27950 [Paenibacillus sp. FSL R5-0912]
MISEIILTNIQIIKKIIFIIRIKQIAQGCNSEFALSAREPCRAGDMSAGGEPVGNVYGVDAYAGTHLVVDLPAGGRLM